MTSPQKPPKWAVVIAIAATLTALVWFLWLVTYLAVNLVGA